MATELSAILRAADEQRSERNQAFAAFVDQLRTSLQPPLDTSGSGLVRIQKVVDALDATEESLAAKALLVDMVQKPVLFMVHYTQYLQTHPVIVGNSSRLHARDDPLQSGNESEGSDEDMEVDAGLDVAAVTEDVGVVLGSAAVSPTASANDGAVGGAVAPTAATAASAASVRPDTTQGTSRKHRKHRLSSAYDVDDPIVRFAQAAFPSTSSTQRYYQKQLVDILRGAHQISTYMPTFDDDFARNFFDKINGDTVGKWLARQDPELHKCRWKDNGHGQAALARLHAMGEDKVEDLVRRVASA